jgi:hypothetical protein
MDDRLTPSAMAVSWLQNGLLDLQMVEDLTQLGEAMRRRDVVQRVRSLLQGDD